jgi:hypothetical protein
MFGVGTTPGIVTELTISWRTKTLLVWLTLKLPSGLIAAGLTVTPPR